jgi:transcriptional regulator with XRE-family HTH domain
MNQQEIKALRQKIGLTTTEFGNLFGVSHSTVVFWENGFREPIPQHMALLMQLRGKIEGIDEMSAATTEVLKKIALVGGLAGGFIAFLAWLFANKKPKKSQIVQKKKSK